MAGDHGGQDPPIWKDDLAALVQTLPSEDVLYPAEKTVGLHILQLGYCIIYLHAF